MISLSVIKVIQGCFNLGDYLMSAGRDRVQISADIFGENRTGMILLVSSGTGGEFSFGPVDR